MTVAHYTLTDEQNVRHKAALAGIAALPDDWRASLDLTPAAASLWLAEPTPLFGAAASTASGSGADFGVGEFAAASRAPALPKVSIADLSVEENVGNAVLTLTLSKAATSTVTVQVTTQTGSAGTADFTAINTTVTFVAGSRTATVSVPIIDDTRAEGAEQFRVKLSAPSGATLGDKIAVVKINANDSAPSQPQINIQSAAQVTEDDPAGGGSAGDGWFSTRGSDIIDADGDVVRMTGVNWFGGETVRKGPDGLFTRNYKDMMDQMKELGFNTIRLPFSNDALRPGATPNDINYSINPDLAGKSSIQVIDAIVAHAGELGIKIILDNHRSAAGDGPNGNGLWYGDGGYSEAQWIADWQFLANRYKNDPTVVGFDLTNEPHNATWGTGQANDWRLGAERAIDAIHAINPEVLTLVAGIGGDTWWGGNLKGVASAPVRADEADKIVYTPHEYGNSLYPQRWFSDPNFPNNMPGVWDSYWGYIAKNDIAPILIGEMGTKLQDPKDVQWINKLIPYIVENGLSFTWWSWNPNSGDTGGILNDDWRTVNQQKMNIIEPALGGDFGAGGGGGGGDTQVAVEVTLTRASTSPVTVAWQTVNGTALAGSDYVAGSGTLTFAAGETRKTINVTVLADDVGEGSETFAVQLRNPNGGTIGTSSTVVTILDDDAAARMAGAASALGATELFLA